MSVPAPHPSPDLPESAQLTPTGGRGLVAADRSESAEEKVNSIASNSKDAFQMDQDSKGGADLALPVSIPSEEPSGQPSIAGMQAASMATASAGARTGNTHSEAGGTLPASASGVSDSGGVSRWTLAAFLLAGLGIFVNLMLWQRLSTVQEQLARQNLDASNQALQANALVKQAQEQLIDASTRIAQLEGRMTEMAAQRQQIDALLQVASRSADDSLLADLSSSLRMAQEQAQLTGSASPLLAALQSAQRRLANATVPGVAGVQRAIANDMARIKALPLSDVGMNLAQVDDLIRQLDQLPAWQDQAHSVRQTEAESSQAPQSGWQVMLWRVWQELRGLVRVETVELPNGVLLSGDQSRQVRFAMRQRLLSARMGLLARQPEAVRADLAAVTDLLTKHFDPRARQSQRMAQDIAVLRENVTQVQQPRIDDSLGALAHALGQGG